MKRLPCAAVLEWLDGPGGAVSPRNHARQESVPVITYHKAGGGRATIPPRKLPPEIGVLLLVVGVAGMLLPGPVGSPFVIAGGLALWPSGFAGAARWLERAAPGMYRHGMKQMDRLDEAASPRDGGSGLGEVYGPREGRR